jgi:hypothetical protein
MYKQNTTAIEKQAKGKLETRPSRAFQVKTLKRSEAKEGEKVSKSLLRCKQPIFYKKKHEETI